MTIEKLYETLRPSKTETLTAQILADRMSVNLSTFFTTLIKDAARCNNYSSDVYYNLREIDEKVHDYRDMDLFTPIFIGFRRHGVDGNAFILSRITSANDNVYIVHNEYFALYSIDVQSDGAGWAKVIINEYWM